MIDQDDLLLLWHLRAHAGSNDGPSRASVQKLSQYPGRAAGQVMGWALSRTIAHLGRFSRCGWRFESSLAPSPQERRLLDMVRALALGDHQAASASATWLVARGEVPSLLRRAAPLAAFYPAPAETGRRAARA